MLVFTFNVLVVVSLFEYTEKQFLTKSGDTLGQLQSFQDTMQYKNIDSFC